MQAVIMAGGKGTRLYDLTHDLIPKSMVNINAQPILYWQIKNLKENGINDIIIIIGHLGQQIKSYFGNGNQYGVSITYIEEKQPLGTGGALCMLKDILKEDFLLIYGDLIFSIDILRMYQYHKEKQAFITLFVHPNSHPYDSDLIIMNNKNKVIDMDSKYNIREYWYHNCTNAGIYILNPLICTMIQSNQVTSLDELIHNKIKEKYNVYAYLSSEYVHDVGNLSRFAITEKDLSSGTIEFKNFHNKQCAIFLDRDGVINKDAGFIYNEQQFELLPNVEKAIKLINCSLYLSIIVTNQPVIARGLCSEEQLHNIHNKMETILGSYGAYINKIYYCPHHPDSGYPEEVKKYKIKCNCRKPNIGMILQAKKDFNLDLSKSWIIGDRESDILTGINAGLHTILIGNKECNIKPNYIAKDLYEAVCIILGDEI